jgi:hypothetical protein
MQHLSLSWTLWKQKYHCIWHKTITKSNKLPTSCPPDVAASLFRRSQLSCSTVYHQTPQVCHHLLDHMITSPYSFIRLAQIDTDPCHLRWTTDSSLEGCDAVLLSGFWWFKQSQSFRLQGQAVQEKCLTPKMVLWFNAMSHTQQHSWDSLKSCTKWHNWRKCQVYSFGHYKPHEKVSHLRTFHYKKLQDFDRTAHINDKNRVAGHTAGRELTCACKIIIQNP